MSRTQRRGGNTSPIKRYLDFRGSTGTFTYYDKDKRERVELEQLELIVLDVRASVSGFDSDTSAQITSNLVAETGKDILKVVSWKDKKVTNIAEGLYKNIKDTVKAAGGKFTTNVICLCDVTGEGEEICNVQFQGSSLNGWINFIEEIGEGAEYDSVIKVKRGALSKLVKGKFIPVTEKEEKDLDAKLKKNPRAPRPIWFYVIDFKTLPLTENDIEIATEQDIKVQKYFEGFTDKKKVEATDDSEEQESYEQTAPEDDEEDDKDALPF